MINLSIGILREKFILFIILSIYLLNIEYIIDEMNIIFYMIFEDMVIARKFYEKSFCQKVEIDFKRSSAKDRDLILERDIGFRERDIINYISII